MMTNDGRLWPRSAECLAAGTALVMLSLPMIAIAIIIKLTSAGPVLHWSERVGRDNALFRLPKFRTMRVDAPNVATHLLENPEQHITSVGAFLRKSSLDELPQLLSIMKGDITFVGPRPALFNQHDLVAQRTACGVHRLLPGLTGWAQVNGRDTLSIEEKVALDAEYLRDRSLVFDLKIIAMTAWKVLRFDGVTH